MGGGGKGGGCQTTGYRYFCGLHLIFCHSLDALQEIMVGEKTAWSGSVSANQSILIDKYDLFGGEGREGGIRGTVDICFGNADQGRNAYLRAQLGDSVPAYRGLFGLVANRIMVSMNNPYIKGWSALGTRTRTGWRDDLAGIVAADGYVDMNPAHIIRECLVNTEWGGLGYPESDLDDRSFVSAANLLAAEKFGLSLLWARNSTIEDFINIILDHIDGVLYYSHVTGLLTLTLIRNDYNKGTLPVLNESNILEMSEFANPASSESINQVTLNYVDRRNQACAVTVQDIAGINRTGGQIIAASLDRVGIADPSLASMAATRILTQAAMPIASCTLIINREHSDLQPGSCFALDWSPLGIAGMVMRATEVRMGKLTDNRITVKAVRDVFSFGAIALSTPAQTLWISPNNAPKNAPDIQISELTWWQFVREYAGDSSSVLAELEESSTFVICFCGRPTQDALNYEMWDRNKGAAEWVKKDVDSFPFIGSTRDRIAPEIASTIILRESFIDTDIVRPGTYAQLGDELVAVTAVDAGGRTVAVNRGVLDTVPVAHAAGTKLWFFQGLYGLDREERAQGEAVEVKILPSTGDGRLALGDADTSQYTCVGRMMRPYPPGNVRVNGSRWPASIGADDELTVSWAHRDRTAQTVTFNRQDEGNIGPESGVTYTLRIYGETGRLLRTETGLTGTGYTYAKAAELTDSGLPKLNASLRFELEAARGSLVSITGWNLTVTRRM